MEKKKTRLEKLKEVGLVGCLNDTGVTSQNYKQKIYEDIEERFLKERSKVKSDGK